MYVEIAVNFKSDDPHHESLYTYKISDPLEPGKFKVGDLILVPLGRQKSLGMIVKINCELPEGLKASSVKNIIGHWDLGLQVDNHQLKIFQWMNRYYHYPLGKLVFDIIPTKLTKSKNKPFNEKYQLPAAESLVPTESQQKGIDYFKGKLNQFNLMLLHGVTGSGKTLVYIHLMKELVQYEKKILFLVPEINLTQGLLEQIAAQLPHVPLYGYHSGTPSSEKSFLWTELAKKSGAAIVVGARSAVFLPLKDLALIIIDEEHDASYRQEDRICYDAKRVSYMRAKFLNVPVLLGSATPSVDTFHLINTPSPHHHYYYLASRAQSSSMPKIIWSDIRFKHFSEEQKRFFGKFRPIDQVIYQEIKKDLSAGGQVLVFLNKLGLAQYLQCSACGHKSFCPNCSVTMRYFSKKNKLICQVCTFVAEVPNSCSECGNLKLGQKGYGTEKVQQQLQLLFPDHRIGRFDRDELNTPKEVFNRIDEFRNQQFDMLVGTQMLSKGHNFSRVNLVVILGIDEYLNTPSFRAMEQTLQMLVQVAGRSGRFSDTGRVIIQTLGEAKIFQPYLTNDLLPFYDAEIQLRKENQLPPFYKLIQIEIYGKNSQAVEKVAKESAQLLAFIAKDRKMATEVLGPIPAAVEKRKNYFYWHVLLKDVDAVKLHELYSFWVKNRQKTPGIKIRPQVDPN